MDLNEFSNNFDVLFNSYSNTPEFGRIGSFELDEYEKSIFLTKAQEEVVLEFYKGINSFRESFESNEEIRRYLSNLVNTVYLKPNDKELIKGVTKNSLFFHLPDDLWFITYESATIDDSTAGCKDGAELLVVPTTQDNFYDINENPFRGPNKRRALRLDINNNTVELVSRYKLSNYTVRYLIKPTPIVLINLPNDLSIDGVNTKTECKLNPVVHKVILERAVRDAIISKASTKDK